MPEYVGAALDKAWHDCLWDDGDNLSALNLPTVLKPEFSVEFADDLADGFNLPKLELTELLYPDILQEFIAGLSIWPGTYHVFPTGNTGSQSLASNGETTIERAIAIARASLADDWAALLVIPGALARLRSVTRSARSG